MSTTENSETDSKLKWKEGMITQPSQSSQTGFDTSKLTSVDKHSDLYNMNHKNPGKCVIFNHYEFENFDGKLDAENAKLDAKYLKDTFESVCFDVIIYENKSAKAMQDILEKLAEDDYVDTPCLIIAILTEMDDSEKLRVSDYSYSLNKLIEYFVGDKCPTLAGKPKIFLVQASRGGEIDRGVKVSSQRSTIQCDGIEVSETPYKIPTMADCLIMYSSYKGYGSGTNQSGSSLFVEALRKNFKKYGTSKDLLTILTFANRSLALSEQQNGEDYEDFGGSKKQVGTIVSSFTRRLFFNAKTENVFMYEFVDKETAL